MNKQILVALAIPALIGAAAVAWLAFLPNVPGDEAHSVRLPEGTGFEAALDSLESAGAVSSTTSLRLFGTLTGWGDQVKTGHYLIQPGMSNWAVLDKVRKGLQDDFRITIPPGLTPARFGRVLHNQLGADSAEAVAAVTDAGLAEQLGTDAAHLLGHMRADTYDIRWTTDARRAVARIHEWHDRFWTAERKARAERLGLTPDEVTTMASIVEMEARKPEEMPRIAGVYLNRLLGRTSSGTMRLQADPTVQFALMAAGEPRPRRLLFVDYRTPSPYNTYLIDGLPPGPITNPSDRAVDAVLDAERHDFLYFVADGTGGHDFSRTVGEHNAKAARWSRYMTEQTRIRRQRETAAGISGAVGAAVGAATGEGPPPTRPAP
ncbi:MAG TPA: endolytic transglycosylase MltG [Rubricoccaceae bacterium]